MSSPEVRRNVLFLSLCVALSASAMSLLFTVAAVIGYSLAPDKSLSTLPVAFTMIAMMATTAPSALMMSRFGRRVGFWIGSGIGMVGAVAGMGTVYWGNFWLLCVACACIGSANAIAMQYRFAAAEAAPPEFRSRAISLTMLGGLAAAFVGPNLASFARNWFDTVPFLGTFLALIGIQFLLVLAISQLRLPDMRGTKHDEPARPLRVVIGQPAVIVAMIAGALGYAVMSFVMTATPLAILDCNYEFGDAAFIIQWHVVGMYAPGFFTGNLIRRFGALGIIQVGAVLNLICLAFGLAGEDLIDNFWPSLVLLGVGWNFMFVGATTFLTENYRPAEQARVQAINEFVVFGTVAIASLSAGSIYAGAGWSTLLYSAALPVGLVMLVLAGYALRRRHQPA
ncbi:MULTISPECIES: MFS transporter [Thalassospira]|uniref:Major facilitator transporter n=2 Tax=Thalassospira TaxID=168934 RepID=A0AB72UCS2_9PROT|nr:MULTISPECIES: MFS transporter [Thalassospira]AJD51975.1 major facilitator transporter [Thalassospira xiamenensis M-5 = DSM 17429]SIS94053.1 Predicted arabinose efflux permease, MFS family [Thalassospira xiamenensis M-5 = DSM 17429]